jgi:hypothetical protein
MTLSKKAPLVTLVFVLMLVQLGQPSVVHADPPMPPLLESKAFACLTNVYPVDLKHYNITLRSCYTLPSAPSDTYMTQAVDYQLDSSDSRLLANFLFRDDVLYSCNLRVLAGSVAAAQPLTNVTDAARDFLEKYQAYSGADSTELIHILSMFDETKSADMTLGDLSLGVSHLVIPNAANDTSFVWNYIFNGTDNAPVSISFDKGAFYSFTDFRQFYTVGSAEAISAAQNYIENYSYTAPDGAQISGFSVNKNGTVAKFSSSFRNGSALYPCWNVTLILNQTYPGGVNALLAEVWADSDEVFNCSNQAVGSVPVDNSRTEPPPTPQLENTTISTATPPSNGNPDSTSPQVPQTITTSPTNTDLTLSAETSSPNLLTAGIMGAGAAVTATTIAAIIAVKRRCK